MKVEGRRGMSRGVDGWNDGLEGAEGFKLWLVG